jgi:uncharacterized protein (TIGR02246 family)
MSALSSAIRRSSEYGAVARAIQAEVNYRGIAVQTTSPSGASGSKVSCVPGAGADGQAGKNGLEMDDENAIRALLARLYDAWARADGEAYAACFAEQSDYITFNGMHLRGRAENARLHAALFRGVLRGTTLAAEIESLELLSGDVALVHTAAGGRKKSFQTYVLVKSGSGWLIRSFQNTRVQPFSVRITRWLQHRGER